MQRAIVLIGVRSSGGLPRLQAVGKGLDAMRDWAIDQGIPTGHVTVRSDEDGTPVRASDVFDAVHAYVDRGVIGQLIVYFCGHGVNNNGSEFWLLTGAPANPNEAINVARSIRLAERCGIPHVVLVSDACRTAPTGIQADDVTGSEIFPNLPATAATGCVDVFYACRLGEPAFEIADAVEASRSYRAVYTEVFAEALRGMYPDLRERIAGRDGDETYDVVRPYPLRKALPKLVTTRIRELKATTAVVQEPEGRVCSDPYEAWLSRLEPARPAGPPSGPLSGGYDAPEPLPPLPGSAGGSGSRPRLRRWRKRKLSHPNLPLPFPEGPSGTEIRDTVQALRPLDPALTGAKSALIRLNQPPSAEEIARLATSRVHTEHNFENIMDMAVLRVHGSELDGAETRQCGQLRVIKDEVWLEPVGDWPTTVLVQLASGHCAFVPAYPGYLGTLTIDDSRLVDVSYISSRAPSTDPDYLNQRAWMAVASRYGLPWWEETGLEGLVRLHDRAHDGDPSIDLYVAYAMVELGRRDLVDTLLGDDRPALYDVRLLARDRTAGPVVPPVPLLARGWALLEPSVARALPTPLPSHWTLFAAEELSRLREVLTQDQEGAP
ncbi:hypothetical protein [Streptomyces sp. XH2]|uniref:hypothetical protein n=1 Tax=Streptomyces sp. XH2 TaxID=3412483 RepID=UPI003C7C3B8D